MLFYLYSSSLANYQQIPPIFRRLVNIAKYLRRLQEEYLNNTRKKRARDYTRTQGIILVNYTRAIKKATPPIISPRNKLAINQDRYKVYILLRAYYIATNILLQRGLARVRAIKATNFIVNKALEESIFRAISPKYTRKFYLGASYNQIELALSSLARSLLPYRRL